MKRRKRTNKWVPAKGRLREFSDRLWSKAVLDDWAYKCAVCGKIATDAHHLVPRQHTATRYDLECGIGLCSYDHIWNPDVAPHQNAAAWLQWLTENHPERLAWLLKNSRPEFNGTKNAAFYCGVIRRLKQYVEPNDYERIVGVRFAAWLEAQNG